jgi:hypothetical protein
VPVGTLWIVGVRSIVTSYRNGGKVAFATMVAWPRNGGMTGIMGMMFDRQTTGGSAAAWRRYRLFFRMARNPGRLTSFAFVRLTLTRRLDLV